MPLTGSCLCGDVAFESEAPLSDPANCHCSMCRKAHGAPFVTWTGVAPAAFRWLRGIDRIRRYEPVPGGSRAFCARCGSSVPNQPEGMERVFVPAGLVEGDARLGSIPHTFAGSRAPWYEIRDAAPQHEAFPPGWGDGVPFPRKTEPTPEAVRGGCLCGAVAYETPRPLANPIVLCHCSRCRRARAAAHNANLFVPRERFHWLRGEDKVLQFKLPDAERYTQAFCRECGGKVPMVRILAVIPAGTLDDDPGVRPALHIFVASKAPWFEIADDLPRYDEYAPGMVASPPPKPS